MSSTQHIVLTVDGSVVYDSNATTTPTPPADHVAPNDFDRNLMINNPRFNTEYYIVTYDYATPENRSNPEKLRYMSLKAKNDPNDKRKVTYTYNFNNNVSYSNSV